MTPSASGLTQQRGRPDRGSEMLLGPVPLPTQFQRIEENNADTDASSLELRLFVNGSPGQCGNALDFLSESCF